MVPSATCCIEGAEFSSTPPLLAISVARKPDTYPLSPPGDRANADAKSPPDPGESGYDAADSCVFCENRGGSIKSNALSVNGEICCSEKVGHKLPAVLEESESFSSTDSQGHTWSSNLSSSTSYTLNRRTSDGSTLSSYSFTGWIWGNQSSKGSNTKMQMEKKGKKNKGKGGSVFSRLMLPWKKLRDGYVGCMMSMEGRGDLSAMAYGGTYGAQARYFADVPMSKRDLIRHG